MYMLEAQKITNKQSSGISFPCHLRILYTKFSEYISCLLKRSNNLLDINKEYASRRRIVLLKLLIVTVL